MPLTAVAITVTGIIWKQSFIRILPLYISLTVVLLQSRANKYAPLIGGFNSILYTFTYIYLSLYASAAYALLFSFPVQILTFFRWSKRAYKNSTLFRSMTPKQRIILSLAFMASFCIIFAVLSALVSSYQFVDSLSSLTGIVVSILTLFAFVEYTWLMIPNCILGIILNVVTTIDHPEQITYLIYSVFSLICVTRGFISVRNLYKEQKERGKLC